MKQYMVYVCETCGYKSEDAEEIMQHEADHLGLTVKEMEQYRALKSFAAYMGSVVSHTKNDATYKAFDDVIQKLLEFEKEHRIKKIENTFCEVINHVGNEKRFCSNR